MNNGNTNTTSQYAPGPGNNTVSQFAPGLNGNTNTTSQYSGGPGENKGGYYSNQFLAGQYGSNGNNVTSGTNTSSQYAPGPVYSAKNEITGNDYFKSNEVKNNGVVKNEGNETDFQIKYDDSQLNRNVRLDIDLDASVFKK